MEHEQIHMKILEASKVNQELKQELIMLHKQNQAIEDEIQTPSTIIKRHASLDDKRHHHKHQEREEKNLEMFYQRSSPKELNKPKEPTTRRSSSPLAFTQDKIELKNNFGFNQSQKYTKLNV